MVRTRKVRKDALASQEILPTLLDLTPDENGCLYPNLPQKPSKANKQAWQEFVAHVRRRDVLFLRLHKGLSVAQVAAYLDVPLATARRDWQDRLDVEIEGDRRALRMLEVQRLDDLMSDLEPAVRREITRGRKVDPKDADYKALDRLIKLQQNRIKLLGLDAPTEQQQEDAHARDALVHLDATLKATADATEYIAAMLASNATRPEDIIGHMREITGGGPEVEVLEGEALEEFLADIDSDLDPSLDGLTEEDVAEYASAELHTDADDIQDAEIVPNPQEINP